jgi:hypothetical protein
MAPESAERPRPTTANAAGGTSCRSPEFAANPRLGVGGSPCRTLEFALRTLEFTRTAGKERWAEYANLIVNDVVVRRDIVRRRCEGHCTHDQIVAAERGAELREPG